MNMWRGLFRLWVLLTAIWLMGCVWFGATNWHWFQPSRVYEVADTNDEKYQGGCPSRHPRRRSRPIRSKICRLKMAAQRVRERQARTVV